MKTKQITKQMHERLDFFIQKKAEDYNTDAENNITTEESQKQNKKIIKKNDGLIEHISKKIIITEDNRQLLSD